MKNLRRLKYHNSSLNEFILNRSALKSTDENLNFFDVVILSENDINNHIEYDIQLKVLKNNQKWTIRKRFR